MTDESLVAKAAAAMNAYEREQDRLRGDESQRIFGHRGAFIGEHHPTQEGRARAALAVLKEAYAPTPPDGRFVFGSHVGCPWIPLEFSEAEDEDGLPLWERPIRPEHASTESERAVIWDAFDKMHQVTEGGCDTRGNEVADMVLDLGFRRSVSEPSTEDQGPAASCHLCVGAGGHEGYDGEWIECSCRRQPQGEPTDDGHLITDCEHGVNSLYDRCAPCEAAEHGEPTPVTLHARAAGKTQALIESLLAQANERGIRVEVVYPQGEPTDAQEYECRQDRACSFGSHSVECEDQNRAALRAAAAVSERGGNRHA